MAPSPTSLLVLLAALVATTTATLPAAAQTSFTVTLQQKSTAHPFFGQGESEAFVIDGVEANTLTLTRGETYVFQMSNIEAMHPFYISTSATGGGGGTWSQGVEGNFASGNQTLTFAVPENAPSLLYYQCGAHLYMGGTLNVVGGTDTEPGVGDDVAFAVSTPYPQPVTTSATLRLDLPATAEVSVSVYDLLGRQVISAAVETFPAGVGHEIRLNTMHLGAGIYVYRLRAQTSGEVLVANGSLVRAP
jgi:hypothetical protein